MGNGKRANGEGCICKVVNKKTGKVTWKASLSLGRNSEGSLIRKQFTAKTQAEVKSKMESYRLSIGKGYVVTEARTTVQEWFYKWLFDYKMAEGIKPSTVSRYYGIYKMYIKNTILGMSKLNELNTQIIQSHYASLLKNGKSPETIKIINKVLKSSLGQAKKEQIINHNFCEYVSLPKKESVKEIEVFNEEERKKIMKGADLHKYGVIFMLALTSGMRMGELLALKWSNTNLKENSIFVENSIKRVQVFKDNVPVKTCVQIQPPKTKNSIREVKIPEKMIKILVQHKKKQVLEKIRVGELYVDNDFVFATEIGKPIDESNLRKCYKRWLKVIDVPERKFHAFRHTYATMLFEKEKSPKTVQVLLGHKDITTTMNIYTHVNKSIKANAVEELNYLFG